MEEKRQTMKESVMFVILGNSNISFDLCYCSCYQWLIPRGPLHSCYWDDKWSFGTCTLRGLWRQRGQIPTLRLWGRGLPTLTIMASLFDGTKHYITILSLEYLCTQWPSTQFDILLPVSEDQAYWTWEEKKLKKEVTALRTPTWRRLTLDLWLKGNLRLFSAGIGIQGGGREHLSPPPFEEVTSLGSALLVRLRHWYGRARGRWNEGNVTRLSKPSSFE